MPGAARLGDTVSGHDACPPTNLITGASTVIGNGKGMCRVGDQAAPHGCTVHPAHPRSLAMGSSNVITEGSQQSYYICYMDCTGFVITCSDNIIIN